MDTIFALASAQGKAGVAVIRLSGPDAFDAGVAICGSLPKPRTTALRSLRRADGELLDRALVLVFEEGASFTGEQVVEFHVHGSRAVVRAVMEELGTLPGCRLADPGEFTRRALDNGQLTLTEVEGLGDLIEAETELQRKQARALFEGGLRDQADAWRQNLIRVAALIEASIDFADEEIPDDVLQEADSLLTTVMSDVERQRSGTRSAQQIREGFEVAIVGRPNVGKSTLLNAIAQRDAAIVSDVPGTTRDVVEVRTDIGGLLVYFLDTAGLRETEDTVEQIGVQRARDRALGADLRVFLGEGATELGVSRETDDLVVAAKADQSGDGVSGKTGQGVGDLLSQIHNVLQDRAAGASLVSHQRQALALDSAFDHLSLAKTFLQDGHQIELVSASVRDAITALELLVGRIGVEDIYDDIFSSFCLGK